MEKLKDNLPLFSVALVSFSLIRMVFYYHAFGIDITSYIELTEALILSIPFFISQLLLFGGLIFVGALFYELISDTRFAKPIIINHITGLKKEEYKESIKSNIIPNYYLIFYLLVSYG